MLLTSRSQSETSERRFEALKRNYDVLAVACREKSEENDALTDKVEILEQKAASLLAIQRRNQEKVENAAHILLRNKELVTQLEDLQESDQKLRGQLQHLKETLKLKAQTQQRLQVQLNENLQLLEEAQHNAQEGKLAHAMTKKLLEKRTSHLNNLKSEHRKLETDRAEIVTQLDNAKTELTRTRNQLYRAESQAEQRGNATNKSRQKERESQCALAASQEKVRQLTARVAALMQDNVMMRDNVGGTHARALQALHDQVTQQATKLAETGAENERLASELQAKETESETHRQLAEDLKHVNSGLIEKNNFLKDENLALMDRCRTLKATREQLRRGVETQQKEANELRDANRTLQAKIKQLFQQHKSVGEDRTALLETKEELLTARKELSHLKERHESLNQDFSRSQRRANAAEELLAEKQAFHQEDILRVRNELDDKIRHLQEALQDAQKQNADQQVARLEGVAAVQALEKLVSHQMRAESAAEPSFRCRACGDLYTAPKTCQPCGHSFCAECLVDASGVCKECGKKRQAYGNEVLSAMTSAFQERRRNLMAMKERVETIGVLF